jgi:hypothetical protein
MKHVSHISGEGGRSHATHILYLTKRETRDMGARLFFLNMHKKEYLQLFSMRCPLRQHVACPLAHIRELMCAPTCSMLVGTHTFVCVPTGTCGPGARSTAWSTSCLKSSTPLDCHGFKS